MSEILDNSVWPNGLKKDDEGYTTYYRMGTNKLDISMITWPTGDKLVSPYVYQNGRLVGFCDTKALTVSGNTTVNLPYTHIEANFSSIDEGTLTVNAPNATVKKFKWGVVSNSGEGTFDYVIIDFNTTDQSTIDTVRSAYRVVDKTMYAGDGSVIGTWDTSKLEVGGIVDEETGYGDGDGLFYDCSNLTTFTSDLSSLTNGDWMFCDCRSLTTFTSDLSSLTNGSSMLYYCENLESFTSNLSSLTNGDWMFGDCRSLSTFECNDLNSLTDGEYMFHYCLNLESFTSDLSSLTNGKNMFSYCYNLRTFTSDLSSLTDGEYMFQYCNLDTASIKNIAETIKSFGGIISAVIHLDIRNSTPTTEENNYLNQIHRKGWSVYVNGSNIDGESESNEPQPKMINELGEEETTTLIPYYAKLVPSDEENASYVDKDGNFFNILGGQFIYVNDPETYGMFTSIEDAAANMRLTKIEKTRSNIKK